MKCYKRRIMAGAVCEQIVYRVPDGASPDRPRMPRKMTDAQKEAHRNACSRRRNARMVNANFVAGQSLYVTLTFDVAHEVYDFDIAKRILKNYMRMLTRVNREARIMAYMGRGARGERIHFHLLIHGIPRETVLAKWKYGCVLRADVLRAHNFYGKIDHGADFTALANYLWEHWTPEQGVRRWRQTRTVRQPEAEAATECRREYSEVKAPLAPRGFRLVEVASTAWGYLYFKYVRIPDQASGRQRRRE